MFMTIRSFRERVIQTCWFEAIGLLAFTPLLALTMQENASASLTLLIALSITAMTVSALFNSAFDWLEYRHLRRRASDRPHLIRLLHAGMMELCITCATLPLVKFALNTSWLDALWIDLGLLILYAVYGYFFHLFYDHIRPVTAKGEPAPQRAAEGYFSNSRFTPSSKRCNAP
jgi:uncharacterized membrane protein